LPYLTPKIHPPKNNHNSSISPCVKNDFSSCTQALFILKMVPLMREGFILDQWAAGLPEFKQTL